MKLVLWSGTTWLMEIVGSLMVVYVRRPQGEWYDYLWYFPTIFNSLRGLGIFIIISLNHENKAMLKRTMTTISSRLPLSVSKYLPSQRRLHSKSTWRTPTKRLQTKNSVQFFEQNKPKENPKTRSTSVSTVITNLSSFSVSSSTGFLTMINEGEPLEGVVNPRLFLHSISQVDLHPTLPEVFEDSEDESQDQEAKDRDIESSSLDNTSMEDAFWEENLKEKRCLAWEDVTTCSARNNNLNNNTEIPLSFENNHKQENTTSTNVRKIDFSNFYYCTRL